MKGLQDLLLDEKSILSDHDRYGKKPPVV